MLVVDDTQRKQPLASSDLRWSQGIGPLVPIFTPTGTLGSCSPWKDVVKLCLHNSGYCRGSLIKISARMNSPKGDGDKFPFTRVKFGALGKCKAFQDDTEFLDVP